MAIDNIPKVGKIYKTVQAAYNALKKGFKSKTKRDPNPIEDKMIMEEAKTKIQAQGDNISVLDDFREEGIGSLASGTKTTPPDVTKGGIIQNPDVFGDFDNVEEVIFKPGMDKRGKVVKESPSQREADLDRPFVTEDEASAFTLEENARKLNKAKGFIDEVGAKTTGQKLFVADLIEDVGQGIFKNVDMGATFRSNMYDDLLDLGIDDDTVLDIMYSNTKSNDFGISMAKIKSNAVDKGVKPEEIAEVADFYERVFYQVNRPRNLKADGGRMGFADGPDDPKKLIKKVPKVGKVVSGIESLKGAIGKIMNRFGEDAITTADKVDQPEKSVEQMAFEFNQRNKPDAITIESREILDVPPVPEGFKLSKEKLMAKFPELDEDFADQLMAMDKDTAGRIIKMLENRRLNPEAYDRLLDEYGDTLEFQGKFDEVIRRSKNASGGLPHILGV
jgi:hypothetical protein